MTKNQIIDICEIFEDFLDERNITINNPEREEYVKENGEDSTARIFGEDWDELCDSVENYIRSILEEE